MSFTATNIEFRYISICCFRYIPWLCGRLFVCLSFFSSFVFCFLSFLSWSIESQYCCFYITMQQRRERVLSLTTSLVTPLNLVMVGVSWSATSLLVIDRSNDCGLEPTRLLHEFILCVVVISEPFSDGPAPLFPLPPLLAPLLLRDWARCFFKLANVVPESD